MFDGIEEEYVGALPQVAQPVDPVLAVLVEARRLLTTSWCQIMGTLSVGPHPGCINDKVILAAGRCGAAEHMEAIAVIGRALPVPSDYCSDVFDYNDTHTHAESLALMDRAIAARKAGT